MNALEHPVTIDIGGMPFVYLDEDQVASLQEMIDFVNANRSAFYRFRYLWGPSDANEDNAMTDTPVTIDQMHDQIVQIITMLDAIPPDQRTNAQDNLLLNLQHAIEQYDVDDDGEAA